MCVFAVKPIEKKEKKDTNTTTTPASTTTTTSNTENQNKAPNSPQPTKAAQKDPKQKKVLTKKKKGKKRRKLSDAEHQKRPDKEGCLVRATDGDATKVYTVVSQKDWVKFQTALLDIYKSKMSGLLKGNEAAASNEKDNADAQGSKKRKRKE